MLSQDTSLPTRMIATLRDVLGDRLRAVVLYGSQARGDARPSSDWDVLVIAEGLPDGTLARHLALKRALPDDCRAIISIIAKTPDELSNAATALFLDIALDGRILYDPYGIASRWIGRLRLMMQNEGLRRERTPAGDIWLLASEPPIADLAGDPR